MLILIALLVIAMPLVVVLIRKSWKKYHTATVQDMEHDYQLMDDKLQETKDDLQTTKKDRSKLQKAWIVNLNEVAHWKHWKQRTTTTSKLLTIGTR